MLVRWCVVPRNKELKEIFSKPIASNNFENDMAERIISLVKFAYDNRNETEKDKTKGVAFVRQVWNSKDFKTNEPN